MPTRRVGTADHEERGYSLLLRYPGRHSACPYMFFFVPVTTFAPFTLRLAFKRCPALRSFTEASVASRSERAQRGAGTAFDFSATIFRPSLQFGECIEFLFCVFLPPQESETAAPAQGAAVVRASSPCPRTVFNHQSAAQLEPRVPCAPNSNRCQSAGYDRQLVSVRLS